MGVLWLVAATAMAATERSLASVGSLLFALAITIFFGWQLRLVREDVIVVDDRGIEDKRPGIFVEWIEIERVRQLTFWIQLPPQRYVTLKIKEEHWQDVSQRWPHRL